MGFIALGVSANQWVLAWLFSPDGHLSVLTRLAVWGLDLMAIGAGSLLIRYRHSLVRVFSRFFFKRYPNLLALLVGLFLTTLMLAGVEALFYAVNAEREASPAFVRVRSPDLTAPDSLLGHRALPSGVYEETFRLGDEIVFDAAYGIDEYRCRVTPVNHDTPPTQFLMLCGGSFAFGTGVEDDETLAYYLGSGAPEYNVYNFAGVGDGPHHTLAILEHWDLGSQIVEEDGLLVYVFIPQHISRALGSMRHVTGWGWGEPAYLRQPEGPLRYGGPYREVHPWRMALYQLLSREQVLRFLNRDFPPAILDKDIEYAAEILKNAERAFMNRLGSDRFYVVLHPLFQDTSIEPGRVERIFRAGDLQVLNYYDLFDRGKAGYFYAEDQHPTPKCHRRIARELIKDLDLASAGLESSEDR